MLLQQEEQSMLQGSLKQNQDPLGSFLNIKQWRKMDTGTEMLIYERIYARAGLFQGSVVCQCKNYEKLASNWCNYKI